ncbi:MAG: hypothetical protein RR662_05305 [Clostridia bacterium]
MSNEELVNIFSETESAILEAIDLLKGVKEYTETYEDLKDILESFEETAEIYQERYSEELDCELRQANIDFERSRI